MTMFSPVAEILICVLASFVLVKIQKTFVIFYDVVSAEHKDIHGSICLYQRCVTPTIRADVIFVSLIYQI